MIEDVSKIIYNETEIQQMVQTLANRISNDYKGKDLVLIGVLKGGFVFLADLIRQLKIPAVVDFIGVSSYGSSTDSSGVVKFSKDIDIDITGKYILLVEDIIDTGLTLNYLTEILKARGPKSVNICTAFDKPSRRVVSILVKYVGLEVPDHFLVGYGLDYNEKFRSLPRLCSLKLIEDEG